MANEVCFRTLDHPEPWSLKAYESVGGYEVFRNIIQEQQSPKAIIEILKQSALRGRGGAGFPLGTKWSFMQGKPAGQQHYLICNSDEGEPGTFKDRDILRFNPHQVIEGLLIGAYVTGASVVYNYLRGEFHEPFLRMEAALEEARALGLVGQSILGSDFHCEIHTLRGAGAYIVGEETALMDSIEGKKAFPRFKPPFPANRGLYGCPTTINNTESIASVPVILQKGAAWFLGLGKANNGGTKIFSVSGHVNKPGNYEVSMGIPFRDLLALAGGMREGQPLKAVIPGGSSAPVLPADIIMDLSMDYDALAKAGSMLGSGGVIVMDAHTSMPQILSRLSQFYAHESCGQCSPCREGTGWVARLVNKIYQGEAKYTDIDLLENLASNIAGRTICAFGEAAAMPVQSFIKYFRPEFEACIRQKASGDPI